MNRPFFRSVYLPAKYTLSTIVRDRASMHHLVGDGMFIPFLDDDLPNNRLCVKYSHYVRSCGYRPRIDHHHKLFFFASVDKIHPSIT